MFFRRKAILLIHGFIGGIYDFDNLPNELEIYRNFDVYTYTLPGHEKLTVKNVKYKEWIESAEKQIEFLLHNHYKEIYLIGHSMGAVIATYLASKYPEVKKLVLAAPAYRYFCFKDGKINIKNFNETIKNMPEVFKGEGKEKVIERIKKTPISTMIEFTKLVSNYQNYIKKITCPILIIHGLNDLVVPKEATEYVYNENKSKSSTLVNIKEVTHDCFTKKRKEEVMSLIISFLHKTNKNIKQIINL